MKALAAARILAFLTALLVLAPAAALSQAPESPAPIVATVDDGTWTELPPPGRAMHPAIYDPGADRMIVFGGTTPNRRGDLWSLTLSGTPFWSLLAASGSPAPPLNDHTAIYDPVRRRMLVFGGQGFGATVLYNDVWELSLAGAPAWTHLSPTGTPPPVRKAHTAIYDPVRNRMIVFGGVGASHVILDDVWALSLSGTPAWTQITPSGSPPASRLNHVAIYDSIGDRMVVFGGEDSEFGATLDDTWGLSLGGAPAWSPIAASGNPVTYGPAAVIYDPVRARMVLTTGASDPSNALWVLSLTGSPAWTLLSATGGPPPDRYEHSAIYDPLRDRLIIYGGDGYPFSHQNDVWAVALPSLVWTEIGPLAPTPRHRHTAIVDIPRQRMIVYGGWDTAYNILTEVWSLSLSGPPTWTQIMPSGPTPPGRGDHSAIFDALRERMIVFSGSGANDVWALSLGSQTWSQLTPSGTLPSARSGHTAIYDSMRDRMIVFGGNDGADRNDVWELTLSGTPTWNLLSPAGSPPGPRSQHTAIYDWMRDRMIVHGGFTGTSPLADDWTLSLAGTPTWTQLAPTGGPPYARGKHVAILDEGRDRMVIFSGSRGGTVYSSDVWALSLAGAPIWTQLAPAGELPIGREQHTAVYDAASERLVVLGGFRDNSLGEPLNLYDAAALEWNALVAVPAPGAGETRLSARVAPNPASGPLTIDYTLPRGGSLAIRVYDLSGRVVRTLARGASSAGSHTARWNRRDERGLPVRAGVYFAALEMDGARVVKRLVLLD